MFDSWIAAADGWIVRDGVSTYFISPVGLLGYRRGIIAPCADGKGLGAAIAWLDEQLRMEAQGPSAPSEQVRIDGWTTTLAAPEMVPVKIVRHEKPHCRYWLDPFEENAERVAIAATPTPIVPDCYREPGAMADHMKVYNGAVANLEASVKRTIREWPLCSITGEAVPLRIDEHGDELIAFWNCRCGEEELP